MRTALFTGATGFLGSNIAKKIISNGWRVVAITNGSTKNRLSAKEKAAIVWIENENDIYRLISNELIDVFFDCAVQYQRTNTTALSIEYTNVHRPIKIMNALAQNNQKTTSILFDSFFTKFKPSQTPQPIYTAQKKVLIEKLKDRCNKIENKTIVMRLEHVYGPGDNPCKVLPTVCADLLRNISRISLSDGLARRDLVYVDDVVSAVMCALTSASEGFSLIECGTGTSHAMRYAFEILKRITRSTTVLGFNDISSYDSIVESSANIDTLKQWGWMVGTDLEVGLEKLVVDVANTL